MTINKRPISEMKIYFGLILVRAIVTALDGDDPIFGGMVKDSYNYAAVEKVVVIGIRESETKEGLLVDLCKVDNNGKRLETEDAIIKDYLLRFDQENVEFKENVWCDEESRVQQLCAKLNKGC